MRNEVHRTRVGGRRSTLQTQRCCCMQSAHDLRPLMAGFTPCTCLIVYVYAPSCCSTCPPPCREALPVPGPQAGGRPQPALCGAGARCWPGTAQLLAAHARASLACSMCCLLDGAPPLAAPLRLLEVFSRPRSLRPTLSNCSPASWPTPLPLAGRAGAARGADRPAAAAGVREAAAGSGQHAAARRRRRRHRRVGRQRP